MSDSSLCTEEVGDVLIATMNRPPVLNALDDGLLDALLALWEHAAEKAVGAVVLTGAGRGFCSGADQRAPRRTGEELAENQRHRYNANVLAMAALDCPVIAAVNGVTAGAGLSLACAADVRIAAEGATFVPSFAAAGVVPDMGASWMLPQLIGRGRALDWLCSTRALDAREALAIGLVSEVVTPSAVVDRSVERAAELCRLPAGVVGLTKHLVAAGCDAALRGQLEREVQAQQSATVARSAASPRQSASNEEIES